MLALPSASRMIRRHHEKVSGYFNQDMIAVPKPPSFPLRVVVVGAGLGGLTCAVVCKKHDLDVVVLERAPQIAAVSSTIAGHLAVHHFCSA